MDGQLKISLDEWIKSAFKKQQKDISYVDSFHIDEILQYSVKRKWINDSFSILKILNDKIKAISGNKMIVILVFTLNRSREKNKVIKQLDYLSFNKIATPPEFFLIEVSNHDFLLYIEEKSSQVDIENLSSQMVKTYYMEEWNQGFDRYLWIYYG